VILGPRASYPLFFAESEDGRSETRHGVGRGETPVMGFAALNPSYAAHRRPWNADVLSLSQRGPSP
jgi:hypothetical protein